MLQPPFPTNSSKDEATGIPKKYLIPQRQAPAIQPLTKDLHMPPLVQPQLIIKPTVTGRESAAELIRSKVQAIYSEEPSAKEELSEVTLPAAQQSKHQQFMYKLSTSGKPLAQIQTEWHNYYVALPDSEKHEVWREFYETNARNSQTVREHHKELAKIQQEKEYNNAPVYRPEPPERSTVPVLPYNQRLAVTKLKRRIVDTVGHNVILQEKAKQQLKSLAFGIGAGLLVLFILLFSFFNEMFIAPLIQPSRHVSATPLILSSDSIAANASPEVIIPKINVQIPVVYNISTTEESVLQQTLEDGVIHYPTTSLPGQQGNAAFFGHSSNNIFNKGKYKFAFVLLSKLEPGDVFYLTYNAKVYSYRVFEKRIVPPSEVAVLHDTRGKAATATLITCDPPGTSTNRLVVWGEQIDPDPSLAASPTGQIPEAPVTLPSEGPSLWTRLWRTIFN